MIKILDNIEQVEKWMEFSELDKDKDYLVHFKYNKLCVGIQLTDGNKHNIICSEDTKNCSMNDCYHLERCRSKYNNYMRTLKLNRINAE